MKKQLLVGIFLIAFTGFAQAQTSKSNLQSPTPTSATKLALTPSTKLKQVSADAKAYEQMIQRKNEADKMKTAGNASSKPNFIIEPSDAINARSANKKN